MVVLSSTPHKAADNFSQKLPAAECTMFSAQRACAEKEEGVAGVFCCPMQKAAC